LTSNREKIIILQISSLCELKLRSVKVSKMAEETRLDEELLSAWVRLTAIFKNGRITQGMQYNEAIVMLHAYKRFEQDGEGLVSFKELLAETKMLKSLLNRTVDSLVKKGFLEKCAGDSDKRTVFVRPVKESLSAFLKVHARSLALAQEIVSVIGEEDAQAFIRISQKIAQAGTCVTKQGE